MARRMFVNIIHRADSGEDGEAFRFQQEVVHRLGIVPTVLVPYPSMYDRETVAYVKAHMEQYHDEVGIHFYPLQCPQFREVFDSRENALYLYAFEERKRILRHIFGKFEEVFGFIPSAIGGYLFDARTLAWIKQEYPQVKAVISICFEMRGIVLTIDGADDRPLARIEYNYRGREIRREGVNKVSAHIPQLQVCVSLASETTCDMGIIEEGIMFNANFHLKLTKTSRKGEEIVTWMRIRRE